MTKIIFVDDDPMVLQGLRRTLHPMRMEWSMAFADGAPRALEIMAQSPFDVIVSDMRMPGLDGADLLNEVMRLYPGTVRLALSGHSDRSLVMKCVGAAHQYLAKPCDTEQLKGVIRQTMALNHSLANQKLQQVVAKLDRLPTIPRLYSQIATALRKPDVDAAEVGDLISRDISMTAEILKVVNSAFFGLGTRVSSPSEAVRFLGVETVRTLILVVHLCSEYRTMSACADEANRLWDHSYRVAALAREIALAEKAGARIIDETFAAALLHDIGKLVLAANLPQLWAEVRRHQAGKDGPREIERQLLGSTHADVGGYLLGLWGLPARLVEAVSLHHTPHLSADRAFSPLTAVHVADWLVYKAAGELCPACGATLDAEYLESLNLADHLGDWEACLGQI
jgi:HD-like signal output (HDOD) protein